MRTTDTQRDEWWVDRTTYLMKHRRDLLRDLQQRIGRAYACGDLDRVAELERRGEKHERDYLTDILNAWRAHRPNGPRHGETYPHEVLRAMGKVYSDYENGQWRPRPPLQTKDYNAPVGPAQGRGEGEDG